MAKFNIMDLIQTQEPTKREESLSMEHIHIDKLIPSENNFYQVEEIDELANSILLCGMMHNLVVERDAEGNHILISGHRRRLALKKLVTEGYLEFAIALCSVKRKEDDTISELKLILANSTTRVLSDYEKIKQAQKLKELFTKLKQDGVGITGRVRDKIADTMNLSPTKVAQMESISQHLSKDLEHLLKVGELNFTTAYKLSALDEQSQEDAYHRFLTSGTVTPAKQKQVEQVESLQHQTNFDYMQTMDISQLAKYLYIHLSKKGLAKTLEWLEGERR